EQIAAIDRSSSCRRRTPVPTRKPRAEGAETATPRDGAARLRCGRRKMRPHDSAAFDPWYSTRLKIPPPLATIPPMPDAVVSWLIQGDPTIRWQVLRDLQDAPERTVLREQRRILAEGWGARLLAL